MGETCSLATHQVAWPDQKVQHKQPHKTVENFFKREKCSACYHEGKTWGENRINVLIPDAALGPLTLFIVFSFQVAQNGWE